MKALLCLILLCAPVFAQSKSNAAQVQPCSVTIDKVPLIRGLRLGQPYKHLDEVLPRRFDHDSEDEVGLRRVYMYPWQLDSPESLEGVDDLSLIYFDDSLVEIAIQYKRDTRWASNLHFVAAIAQQLNLPREGWKERDPSILLCDGFLVEIGSANIMPRLRISDTRFAQVVLTRKKEIEEKKRARFKP